MATKNVGSMTPVDAEATDLILGVRNNRVLPLKTVPPTGAAKRYVLGVFNIAQTAAVLIASGVRDVTVTGVTGLLKGDDVQLYAIDTPPAGYDIGTAVATANGTLIVKVNGPALALGATFSIPCRVVVIR